MPKKKPSNKLIIEFPTPEDVEEFLGYLCDGGGEQQFLQDELPLVFSYSRAFSDHGYDPRKHGVDRVVLVEEKLP
jgi:hypothetical protein